MTFKVKPNTINKLVADVIAETKAFKGFSETATTTLHIEDGFEVQLKVTRDEDEIIGVVNPNYEKGKD